MMWEKHIPSTNFSPFTTSGCPKKLLPSTICSIAKWFWWCFSKCLSRDFHVATETCYNFSPSSNRNNWSLNLLFLMRASQWAISLLPCLLIEYLFSAPWDILQLFQNSAQWFSMLSKLVPHFSKQLSYPPI